jgi:hypothetical protein
VAIQSEEIIPWPNELFHVVESLIGEEDEELRVYRKDCSNLELAQTAPAEFLLDEFATSEVAQGYSSSSGISKQEYIFKNSVLDNRVVWLTGLSFAAAGAWREFCKKYRPKSNRNGVIIYEDNSQDKSFTSLRILSYNEFVSENDALVFADLLASRLGYSKEWKGYIARLAVHLLESNIENYEDFIIRFDFKTCEPNESVSHPWTGAEAEKRVWEAQIGQLFSLIERERINFIERFENEIAVAINTEYWDSKLEKTSTMRQDYEASNVRQSDDSEFGPYSVEVGRLYRMSYLHRNEDRKEFLLRIGDDNMRDRLKLLRDMRNDLAHLKKCCLSDVVKFLSIYG